MSKGKPSRRGLINVALTRADDAKAAAVQTEMVKALGRVGEGAEIIVEPRPENEITGAQIRAARELLGWARDRLCPRAGLSVGLVVGPDSAGWAVYEARFLMANAAGAALWVIVWVFIGYTFGHEIA